MLQEILDTPLLAAAILLGALGLLLLVAALAALVTIKPFQFIARTFAGLIFLALGAGAGLVALGTRGYKPFTHEEVAARMSIRPTGPQRFVATIQFSDGRTKAFEMAGDEVYIDAHILKWRPLLNVLGLHTGYQLDRIAGRYQAIEKERTAPRTIHPLADETWVSLFRLRQRFEWLDPLLDAQYGSATFTPVNRPAEFEVRVSTSGLLVREIAPKPAPGYLR
ncbi:MAG: hypothetical protein ABIR98_06490 [Usitatibacter sp.]